jgi:adenylate cyclase
LGGGAANALAAAAAAAVSAVDEPLIYTRIGINSGPMSVGNMGSSFKFAYTVLGDSVNLASRLESINKAYGTQALISETTAKLVEGAFLLRPVDVIRVKGKKKPVAIFELLAEGPGSEAERTLAAKYSQALEKYQARDWEGSDGLLSEILSIFPDDGPAATLRERVAAFRVDPPPADWDGVYAFKDK